MKIAAVRHAVPSTAISNDYVVARLLERNRERFSAAELAEMERRVRRNLEIAGVETRYILGEDEKAVDLAVGAARAALAECGLGPDDLDLIIYAGVGRGLIEPSMAHVIQREIGASRATCFDVIDACASWLRALDVVRGSFLGRGARRALVVNCEAGFEDYATFELDSLDHLDTCFATFTVGEAATATVLTLEDAAETQIDDCYIAFKTFPEYVDLCMIPLDNADRFLPRRNGSSAPPLKFYSESSKLVAVATRRMVECFQRDDRLTALRPDICFSHSVSETAGRIVADRLFPEGANHYTINRRYGNTVSASVPLAMSLAHGEGRLKRGDSVLIVIGSAGLTIGFGAFRF